MVYPLPYNAEAIAETLQTTLLGQRLEVHRQVGSTNDLARQAGRRGEAEGLVILAEEQVSGRGRLGRTWTAPPGCCVLCSVLLRPHFPPDRAFYLTIAASLAIYRALQALCRSQSSAHGLTPSLQILAPTIKWPNDVLIKGNKVAGVLCESEVTGRELSYCVVGFGINVNLRAEELGEVQAEATSLSSELGRDVDRVRLLADVLRELETIYFALQRGQFSLVRDEWVEALETIGRRVIVEEARGLLRGEVTGVDETGALIMRLDSGEVRHVLAGDVSFT